MTGDTHHGSAKRPQSARRTPKNERKVWAEVYPGGDLQIELGHIENSEELYLMSGEAQALREILEELDAGEVTEDGDSEESATSTRTGHSFEVGEELEKIDSSIWKITNRMVDVDTYETLYRLVEEGVGSPVSEILSESQVKQSFETDGGAA